MESGLFTLPGVLSPDLHNELYQIYFLDWKDESMLNKGRMNNSQLQNQSPQFPVPKQNPIKHMPQ